MHLKLETKKVLSLALPAFLTQASFTLTNMVDLMMVGSISSEAIAGVGVGGVLFWNLMVLFGGPVMALGYLCSQSYGAGKMDQFYNRVGAALMISVLFTLPVALFNQPAARFLYTLLGTDPKVAEIGALYFHYRLITFPLEIANIGMEGMIKATGNTGRPMLIRFSSHLVNVSLNYLLIFGKFGFPRLEAAGAGIATMISCITAFVIFSLYIAKTFRRPGKLFIFNRPDRGTVRTVTREGLKISGNELAGSLSFLIYTGIVAGLGAGALAANEIGINITSAAFMPALGFGQAAMIMIGQRIGSGRNREAKKIGLEVQLYCGIFMLGMGIFFFFAPHLIGGLYTREEEVLRHLIPMIRIAAFFQIFDGGQIVFTFCLRGAGDTTYLFWANLLGSALIFIPGVWAIVRVLQLNVIWAWTGMYIFMFLLFLIYGIRFLFIKWDKIKAL